MIHDSSMADPLTYLKLKSLVVSRVPPEAALFRVEDDVNGGENGGDKVEDLLGLNVPVTPAFLEAAVGNNGFETTFEDNMIRITRGGAGVGSVWGGYRIFTRCK